MESLPVPSVQAMVAATGGADVPPRYLRPAEAVAGIVDGEGEAQIPIIDYRRLLLELDRRGEESARLHRACQEWGFFQLINHSVPHDVVEAMKANIQQFFQLPAETKKRFAQERGQLEGYGQLFVVSEDQKLDWADMLYLYTQPPESRNTKFWPDQPVNFRSTLDRYSGAVKEIADSLLAMLAENLGLKQEVIADRCVGGVQSVRMNYYPPCAQADKVVGFSPHSDADLLTLVLQVNHVQGLQIKRNGSWFPVRPVEGALIVNIGDIFEIFTNGRYRSIEHRAVVDPKEERLSAAAFHSPNIHATIGPLKELTADEDEAYKTVDHENFMRLFFATKLEGKSFLDRMKLK
ncbi:S-norcoclaurine synthase 1-like [Triticum dicoccoides]|uniref:S-norcoclaurine synthase 1-like n=1 Tax=Triticum dicoccoides TaxID=85692 RepID=UPI000E7ABD09|nr:S-norcoclaurine synthase 1-like [Triticum dicoccoides]